MRVKNVIPHLVNCDQTAYVKGRSIGESIRLIDDLMNYAVQENLDGLIFAADIEKAFDSVDRKFIFASLEKYGFGPDFIQWIKTLLANNESCVMNNGSSTGFFKIQRGTILYRHTCLYWYWKFYLFRSEMTKLLEDSRLVIWKLGWQRLQMTVPFFVQDKQSINRILNIMKTFGTFSSLNASIEKCEVCWIGQYRFRKDRPANCKLTSLVTSSINILVLYTRCAFQLQQRNCWWQKFFRFTERYAVSAKHLASALSDFGWKDSSI